MQWLALRWCSTNWRKWNLVNFHKGKGSTLHLGWNRRNPVHAGGQVIGKQLYLRSWGVTSLTEASHEPAMHSCSKIGHEYSGLRGRVLPAGQGRSSLSAQPCPAAPEVLCPALSSPGQKRDWTTGASPLQGQKDDWDTGSPLLYRELGFFSPNKCRMERGVSSMCTNIPWRESRQGSWIPLSGAWGEGSSQWTQPEKHRVSSEKKKTLVYWEMLRPQLETAIISLF